jgi:predicted RNA-binding protein with PUA-like domain
MLLTPMRPMFIRLSSPSLGEPARRTFISRGSANVGLFTFAQREAQSVHPRLIESSAMSRAHYLFKSEPGAFSFERLVKDGTATWDGIRNFQARNTMREMKKGDLVFFYHSGAGKEIVGIAEVTREAYQDPTTKEDWSAVDIKPTKPLAQPVTLAVLKGDKTLSKMQVVKLGRISVTHVTKAEFDAVLKLGKTKL